MVVMLYIFAAFEFIGGVGVIAWSRDATPEVVGTLLIGFFDNHRSTLREYLQSSHGAESCLRGRSYGAESCLRSRWHRAKRYFRSRTRKLLRKQTPPAPIADTAISSAKMG